MSINRAKGTEGTSEKQQERLVASKLKASQAWQRLWLLIQSITPSGLVRFLLVMLALSGLLWLIASAFQSLTTFLVGIMMAYITSPMFICFSRFLPRGLPVLIVCLGL